VVVVASAVAETADLAVAAIENADAITKSQLIAIVLSQMGGANHLAQFFYNGTMNKDLLIRPYRDDDFDAVTILWRIASEKNLPDLQRQTGHFFYEDRAYFRDHILPSNDVWVVEKDGRPVAFMAMHDDFIDHLYIDADHQRCGIGQALLNLARERSPEHVWLYTLQANINARAFYEKNGFVAEKFGTSPPPENLPDVEYHWRKS
jgi:ribosomal protein S18 acetylase RimI-like enzyme